jgi:PadR family transcriptional regulator PadR
MPTSKPIGGLEEAVLLTVHALGKNAYGVSIHEALEDDGRKISIGSLYTTLARLEEKGYVSFEDKGATPERGGRAKRFFKLTGQGAKVLSDAHDIRSAIQRRAGGLLPWEL